ncbi:MAG: glycosyltransferase family protein [Flavobacteriaceae bacterium]
MKILYGIQSTGNGHLSRAKEIIPHLLKRVQVDVVLSGPKNQLRIDFPIQEHYSGFTFYYNKNGSINWLKTLLRNNPIQFIVDVINCPVQHYDLVINDFEPITAWACFFKRKRCIALSNQYALSLKNAPKQPRFGFLSIVKYLAPASEGYGFHFKKFDKRVFLPIIRSQVRALKPSKGNHIVVYLPAFGIPKLESILTRFESTQWHVYTPFLAAPFQSKNVSFFPIDEGSFLQDLAQCKGVMTAAGFTTTAEALFLKKPLLVVPLKSQIEQLFNAAVLKSMGVTVIKNLKQKNLNKVAQWLEKGDTVLVSFPDETQKLVDRLLLDYIKGQLILDQL